MNPAARRFGPSAQSGRFAARAQRRKLRWLALGAASLAVGCFPPDDGRAPPLDRIYFPVGLALSADNERLYVTNSDFDLQFNAGTFQVLDAKLIRDRMPTHCRTDSDCDAGQICDPGNAEGATTNFCLAPGAESPCGKRGVKSAADRLLRPGLCHHFDLLDDPNVDDDAGDLLLDAAVITAFATDSLYLAAPETSGDGPSARVVIPTRGDATLHWLDVFEGGAGSDRYIDCGQSSGSSRCDDKHRAGDSADESVDGRTELPIEPFAVASTEDGGAIVTAHNGQGRVSLFLNDWDRPERGPELAFVLEGLAARPVAMAALPRPRLADELEPETYQSGFLVSYRTSSRLDLLRFHAPDPDAERGASVGQAFLERVRSSPITITNGFDTRGVAVSDAARAECEEECGASDQVCLQNCAREPLEVYLANRSPAALLMGHTQGILGELGTNDVPELTDQEPLRTGPSRVQLGHVLDEDGEKALRIFVVSFDSRFVYVYDPKARSIETRIRTGRGPHALAIDADNGIGYVGHFIDSYIGVVDLDRRHVHYGEMVMTIGKPTPPRASK